jgi:hypothetical protein
MDYSTSHNFIVYNGSQIALVANLKTKNYDNTERIFRSTKDC